jgi:hypothetical protein
VEINMSITWQPIMLRAYPALQFGSKFMTQGMMTWIPAVVLCTAIALWRITPDIETIGPRIICAAACLAAILAARKGGYVFVAAFGGIAVIFNPFVPDMMSRIAIVGLYFVFASTVLLGLAVLNSRRHDPALVSLAVQRRVALDCRQQGQTI